MKRHLPVLITMFTFRFYVQYYIFYYHLYFYYYLSFYIFTNCILVITLPGTAGLAYVGTACQKYQFSKTSKTGIAEDHGVYDGIKTVSHEMGHM